MEGHNGKDEVKKKNVKQCCSILRQSYFYLYKLLFLNYFSLFRTQCALKCNGPYSVLHSKEIHKEENLSNSGMNGPLPSKKKKKKHIQFLILAFLSCLILYIFSYLSSVQHYVISVIVRKYVWYLCSQQCTYDTKVYSKIR